MDMFWIESDLIDKVGTKKGYSLDNKWTYAIISAFCQKLIPISHRGYIITLHSAVRLSCCLETKAMRKSCSIIPRADSYGCRDLSCLRILDADWPTRILLLWHTSAMRCAHPVNVFR